MSLFISCSFIILRAHNILYSTYLNNRFQREQLAVHWREWMTDRTLQLYNSNRVYYSLERDVAGSAESSNKKDVLAEDAAASSPVRIDNPDQRITDDVSLSRICVKLLIFPACIFSHYFLFVCSSHRYEPSPPSAYSSSSPLSPPSLI